MSDAARRTLIAGAAIGAAIVVLLAVSWAARRSLAEYAIETALASQQIEGATLHVESVSLGGIDLSDVGVQTPAHIVARSIRVRWSAAGLRERRVDSIAIEGLRIRADLEDLAGGEAAAGGWQEPLELPPRLPVGNLVVDDTVLELTTPEGVARVHIEGSLASDANGALSGGLDWNLEHPWVDLVGQLELSGTAQEATLRLRARPERVAPPFPVTAPDLPTVGTPIRATLEVGANVPIRGNVEIADIDLWLEEPPIGLHGVAFRGALDGDLTRGFVEIERISDRAELPLFPELRAQLRWEGTTAQVEVAGFVRSLDGSVDVAVSGSADPATPAVFVEASLPPTLLGRPGTRIREISPALAATVHAWGGTIEAKASARYGADGVALDGKVGFRELAATVRDVGRLAGLSGAATLVAQSDQEPVVRVSATGGSLKLEAGAFSVTGIAASARIEGDKITGELKSARLVDRSATPLLAPLDAVGRLAGTSEALDFEVHLTDADQLVQLEIRGAGTPLDGRMRADLHLQPLELESVGPRLATLFPVLKDLVQSATGEVELAGEARVEKAATFAVDVALRDIDATGPLGTVTQLNGSLHLAGPEPLVSPPAQQVSMRLVDVGIPLANGLITFELQPNLVLDLPDARWRWAGGEVRTSGRFDLDATTHSATLVLDGLDLMALTEEIQLPGLSGSGTVRGRIPIEVSEASVLIRDGVLESVGPGILRYPRAPGTEIENPEGLDLLRAVLDELHFDELKVLINGDARGALAVEIRVLGKNPNFQGGRPVKLGVTVDANLRDLLRSTQQTYRIPELIQQGLRKFEAREKP